MAVKLGKQEGEIPFGSMDLNVQDEAKATVTFANDASSLYALDTWQNYYSSVGIISGGNGDPNSNFDGCKYEKIGANYWVKWKYIPPGKTDKVTAELLIKNEAKIDPTKVVFKTKAGKVFESSYNATTHNFTITLLGGEDKDGQELYAMHPAIESGKYWNLGKLDIMSYAPVERKMVLVKTSANDNTDATAVQTELNRIYNAVGISWSVSTDNFEYDTQALFDKSSGILSAYNAQMRALNAAYTAAKGTIDTKTAYLFLVSQSSDKDNREVQGFMPRGMQFGYICNGCLTNQKLYSTIAHELGHGVFRLRHIFSTDYGSMAVGMKEKTQMLMDYADGINLPKWQWDQMYDPAILNGVFDSDKEAEYKNPNYNNTAIYINNKKYNFEILREKTDILKERLKPIWNSLTDEEKLIVDLPLIQWKLGFKYGSVCIIHWLEGSRESLKFPYEFFTSVDYLKGIDIINIKKRFCGVKYISVENLGYSPSDIETNFLYNTTINAIKKSYENAKPYLLKSCDFGHNTFKATDIDDKTISYNLVESFSIGDPYGKFDEVGVALGRFSQKVYITGGVRKNDNQPTYLLSIDNFETRYTDIFTFDDSGLWDNYIRSQELGCWSKDINNAGVVKAIISSKYVCLQNNDFIKLKTKSENIGIKIGGDFLIYSDIKTIKNDFFNEEIIVFP